MGREMKHFKGHVSKRISYKTGRKPAPMLALACFTSLFPIGGMKRGSNDRTRNARFQGIACAKALPVMLRG
jgi:hypothetical protein